MRIALLSPPSLAVGPHGGPRPAPLVSTLADGLVARGPDVTLFATGDSTTSAALVSVCPRASADCQDLTPDQWELLLATEVFARSREFDLLHSHAGASALVGASLQEIPVLATIHRVASPAERTLFARMGRRIAFAANSEGERLPELEYMGVVDPDDPLDGYEALYRRLLARRENHRPWGFYEVLEDEPEHKVKRIVVHPGERLSLQLHHRRAEHWLVIGGEGLVTLDDDEILVPSGQAVDIPRGARHRVRNPGQEPLVFIEVQTGDYFGEDDIVRFEDDYGRSG